MKRKKVKLELVKVGAGVAGRYLGGKGSGVREWSNSLEMEKKKEEEKSPSWVWIQFDYRRSLPSVTSSLIVQVSFPSGPTRPFYEPFY